MSSVPADYKQTEVGVIPNTWSVSRISKVMQLINGCAFKPQEWRKQGTPIIRIQNLNDPAAEFNYFQGAIDERNRVAAGDVLFAWSGTLGSSFGARIWSGPDGVLNQHIFKVIADERVFTKHYSYLIFKRVQEDIEKQSHGFKSSFVHVKKADIDNILLPIPPLPEQRAIAAALSDVDALLAKLDQLIAKKRDLKQAAMQQLLTGQTRLPGFSGAWEVKRLEDVASFFKGKGLPKSAISAFGAEPCIHYGELFTQYPETIAEVISRTDSTDGTFRSVANDVLMPTSDVTPRGLAKASCVRTDGVILGGDILVIRSDAKLIFGSFLSYLIRYEEDQVLQLVTGSTVFHLYGSDMKKFAFAMPSLPEQTAIATVLSDMDAELAALEARRDKTRALKQGMMQELLTGRIRLINKKNLNG